MCGFVGHIGIADSARPDAERMLASIAHRGPDRAARLEIPGAALAAVRLRIVGGKDGDQPRTCLESKTAFAMNGEVYNFRSLAADLGIATDSDARVAHRALTTDGPAALARFRGGFALALLSLDGRRLLLARDQFGQRPLFFAAHRGGIVFGSEMRALFSAGVDSAIDDDALADHLVLHFPAPGKTLFSRVAQIMPGECREFSIDAAGTLTTRSHRFTYDGPASSSVRAAFDDALRLHAHRERPASIFLSGGLDSSVVLAGLASAGRLPERAVVGAFPEDPAFDERPFARATASAFGVPLDEVEITANDWRDAMADTARALEEPVAGPGAVSSFILSRAIAREARVVFGGQGGDELFGGYERMRLFQRLVHERTPEVAESYRPLLRVMTAARDATPNDRLAPYCAAIDRARGLESVFSSKIDFARARARRQERFDAALSPIDAAVKFEVDVLLPGLLAVDDRVTAHHAIESRAPLLDQALWATVTRIPWETRSPADRSRALFFDTLGEILPPIVRTRRDKMGFPVPLARWWKGPLRSFAEEKIADGLARRGLIDADRGRALLDGDGHGGRFVWSLVMLELFFAENAARSRPHATFEKPHQIQIGTAVR